MVLFFVEQRKVSKSYNWYYCFELQAAKLDNKDNKRVTEYIAVDKTIAKTADDKAS